MGNKNSEKQKIVKSFSDLYKVVNHDTPSKEKHMQKNKPTTKSTFASPEVFGSPFYNPYTFVPFPEKENTAQRKKPTLLTADERENRTKRYTGLIDLEVKTVSPLLTMESRPYKMSDINKEHGFYHLLTICNDVIVPATSLRGSLRTLLTIITGGTLGYMDTNTFLYQRRDTQIRPVETEEGPKYFLAEVTEAGDCQRDGKLLFGETELIPTKTLRVLFEKNGEHIDNERPSTGKESYWIDCSERPKILVKSKVIPMDGYWRIKLSGSKIGNGKFMEGLFRNKGKKPITVKAELWSDYIGRNRYGDHKTLVEGDLVWIEPKNQNTTEILCDDDIKSIQWARYGRKGIKIDKQIPAHVKPDCLNSDGLVDLVTDLFGQVPMNNTDTVSFASRVRPHNLIFYDCANNKLKDVTLPPLLSPKPGCMAFYRQGRPEDLNNDESELRGYKVYRNTEERGENCPWLFENQGTYDESGRLIKCSESELNKTVDLLKENSKGKVRISFRALSDKELAHLLLSFTVDWKLGGGKPLGLGHCRVVSCKTIDENGKMLFELKTDGDENIILPEDLKKFITPSTLKRVDDYRTTQVPVSPLRYPRAVERGTGGKKNTRAGHVWFQMHAILKQNKTGLETKEVMEPLLSKCDGKDKISAQMLPVDAATPLYGYDCFVINGDKNNTKNIISDIEKFSENKHIKGNEKSMGFHGQNKNTRQKIRDERKPAGPKTLNQLTSENIGSKLSMALDSEMTAIDADWWLDKVKSFGKTTKSSNKWKKRIEMLEWIARAK